MALPFPHLALVFLLGGFGVLTRWSLTALLQKHFAVFPMGTFLVNILGGCLAGAFYTWLSRHSLPAHWFLGISIGFLGGFTTFSAYTLDAFRLLEQKAYSLALLYWMSTPILSLLGFALVVALLRRSVES